MRIGDWSSDVCSSDLRQHWVGDGFPVRSLFSYNTLGAHISPFLLLDYAGPYNFEPTKQRRGVGEHPHRGFETVTIVRSEEHTSELQSLMRISYAVFCLKKKNNINTNYTPRLHY